MQKHRGRKERGMFGSSKTVGVPKKWGVERGQEKEKNLRRWAGGL